jgi:2-C-methyl-D-erythritol 2,4-cyclodiphosphate synthase
MRIGHGYDIHRFEEVATKSFVMLGGVKIPYEKGIVAHSDGDVVIHAVCDALLGACCLGDIGQHFPDTDKAFKNCDSRALLRNVMQKLSDLNYQVVNVDVSIIAQAPKISPHKLAMQEILAKDMQVSINDVNIKATTNEGLDATGNKLGIAVHAVALIEKK